MSVEATEQSYGFKWRLRVKPFGDEVVEALVPGKSFRREIVCRRGTYEFVFEPVFVNKAEGEILCELVEIERTSYDSH